MTKSFNGNNKEARLENSNEVQEYRRYKEIQQEMETFKAL